MDDRNFREKEKYIREQCLDCARIFLNDSKADLVVYCYPVQVVENGEAKEGSNYYIATVIELTRGENSVARKEAAGGYADHTTGALENLLTSLHEKIRIQVEAKKNIATLHLRVLKSSGQPVPPSMLNA
ncbi:hypothetical protein J4E93_000141 [Alternaria ventricosa]|uniref:uncharacterized protein n=1 Tax=Alternaria ventricosa TaxID=1187951 RepID=UPI0020C2901C|nr:uncharacterized protein J4E93_000141 [Alternaria ventricosa]KAI4655429.1 hypothetical protein J4E93_000141 [Alternaria ventricosa]